MLQPSKYFQIEEKTFLIKDNYTLTGEIPPQKLNSSNLNFFKLSFSIDAFNGENFWVHRQHHDLWHYSEHHPSTSH